MVGRKPKPIEQRIRQGNPSNSPLPEPVVLAGRPKEHELATPPEDLPRDAVDFWREYVKLLADSGLLDRVDIPGLEMLATHYALWKMTLRIVKSEGLFTRGSVGQLRPHPAVKLLQESESRFSQLSEQYGLTPLGRTRLGLAELSRRSLASEMNEALGRPDLEQVGVVAAHVITDADVIDDD